MNRVILNKSLIEAKVSHELPSELPLAAERTDRSSSASSSCSGPLSRTTTPFVFHLSTAGRPFFSFRITPRLPKFSSARKCEQVSFAIPSKT